MQLYESERRIYLNAMAWVKESAQLIKSFVVDDKDISQKENHTDLVTAVDRAVESFLVQKISTVYPDHHIIGEEGANNNEVTSDSNDNDMDKYTWIIDPIDGTVNFVNRGQDFAISIGVCKAERGIFGIVYDVAADKMYHCFSGNGAYVNDTQLAPLNNDTTLERELIAMTLPWEEMTVPQAWGDYFQLAAEARGVRAYGATAIEMCEMASGKLGAFVQPQLQCWDNAGARVILQELGCKFSDLQGNAIRFTYNGGLIAAVPKVHAQIIQRLTK